MKKTLTLITLLLSTQAFSFNLKEVSGKYSATSDNIPVKNIITIDSKGKITLVEKSVHGAPLVCNGKAVLRKNLIKSKLTCVNGFSFEQVINLSGVTNLNSFSAPVYSTLFGQEVMMTFKKIE